MAATWEVSGTTATYKDDAGNAVATLTGLASGLKASGGTITGITVTEGANGATGTISLNTPVLGTTTVKLTSSNYQLALVSGVPEVTPTNVTVASSKVAKTNSTTLTFTGALTAGYKLTNAKTITYSGKVDSKQLATVTGLAPDITVVDGKIGISSTDETTGETSFAELITVDDDSVITLKQDALKEGNVTLSITKNVNAPYSLALDSEVNRPNGLAEVAPTINASKGTATFEGTIAEGGHTLSLDNKTVVYTAPGDIKVVVSGVAKTATADDFYITETGVDNKRYASTITLQPGALGTKNVTVSSGNGYQLVLDSSVSQDGTTAKNLWNVSGTTATYKNAIPAYYTYDSTTNAVTYTAQKDNKTLATLKNLVKGLKVITDTYDASTNPEGTGNSALLYDDGNGFTQTCVTVNNSGVITLKHYAFDGKSVSFTNGSDESYSIALADDVHKPETENESWAVSGTTATLKGAVTTDGYAKSSDTTITYVPVTKTGKTTNLATVSGLAKGITTESKTETGAVGMKTKDAETGDTIFTAGLALEETGSDTINISANVLGTTNAIIKPTAGFSYKFALNTDSTSAAGAVPTTAVAKTFWYVNGVSLELRKGYANYYTKTSDTLITQTDESVENTSAATITGLKTGFKNVSEYDNYISVSGNGITLSAGVLIKKDVTLKNNSGNKYVLALDTTTDLTPHASTMWRVNGANAVLQACTSEGYVISGDSRTLTYEEVNPGDILATITGLKSGLKVKDDYKIDGITADEYDPSDETAAKTITLNKKVLGTTDIVLDEDGLSNGYGLALGDTEPIEIETAWRFATGKNAGTAYYDVKTTKAGFEAVSVDSEGESAVDNAEGDTVYKLAYKTKGTVTTTISGLSAGVSDGDLTDPDSNGVITLSSDALGGQNVTLKNAKNGTYTLALGEGISAPELGSDLVWVPGKSKATLTGTVEEAGYELSGDALSVAYTPASQEGKVNELAVVSGIKNGLTAAQLAEGITRNGNELVLGSSVLAGTTVKVTGGAYTLALGKGIHTEATDTTGWLTSGTTANYKSYKSEYYTPNASYTEFKYTKPTAGTTYATITNVASGADLTGTLDGDTTGGTITLEAKHLGTKNATLTKGDGFSLKLASDVPIKETDNVTEWVTTGTTAKYQTYDKAYYTLSGKTVKYNAPGQATVHATVTGIASGATITDVGKVITLSADQLAGKKVTLTGSGYSLKLDDDVEKSTGGDTAWSWKKTSATYTQEFSPGYTLANANTITYSATNTTKTLATLSGLANGSTEGETLDGIDVSDTADSDGKYAITLSSADLFGTKGKITLKGDDYKLAIDGTSLAAPEEGTPTWTLTKKGGTAAYKETLTEGYTVSADAKSITQSAAKTTTLATISGLSLAEKLGESVSVEDVSNDELAENYGIVVSGTTISLTDRSILGTKKITLGKKDDFEFDVSAIAPTAGKEKWAVKGTTATYSETTTDGYQTTDTKTVTYVKEAVGDTIVQVTGLKKGLKTDGTNVGIETKTKVTDDETGTTSTVTTYSNGIVIGPKLLTVDLNSDVLGTTDINLTNGTGQNYKFGLIGIKPPGSSEDTWSYSKGTATYKRVQGSGYTKSSDGLTVTYTKATTTTLATVTGLNAAFTGNLNNNISEVSGTITLQADLLGNKNITLKNGTGSNYSLALGSGIAQQPISVTEWVTSGTSAVYKKYNQAYYIPDANTGTKITYNAPKNTETYATISGIKSGVDINSASAVSDGTVGGTITLTADMLGTSEVKVTNAKTNKTATFTLAIANDVPTAEQKNVTEWVSTPTKSGYNAVYKTYDKGSYSYDSAKNQIKYTKGTNATGTTHASISGASSNISATLAAGTTTFVVQGSELSPNVVIGSSVDSESGTADYAFSFNNDYNNSAIKGSANADNIIVAGDGLSITGGKGDDIIDLGSGSRVGNTVIYANKDGNDTINNFQSGDAIKITSGFNAKTSYTGGDTITVGTGTITLNFLGDTPDYITINGNSYATDSSEYSSALLADDNYSMDAAQLSSIVEPASVGLTPYDINSGLNLTKEDAFTAQITYAKDK